MAVMHFTLLRIMAVMVGALARTVGALSRNFCGMVGASSVVAVMVGAQSGAISVVLGLA